MRHIPLRRQSPNKNWLDKADSILVKLKAATDATARNAMIDANSKVWGELRQWLLDLSHQKCWFSEAKNGFTHWDVEHYRPKKSAKDLDGTEHDGYWWLAFAWQNFRICGNAGNRMKGTFFPLRSGCTRCVPHGDLRYEDPMLLDPADEDDPNLITFNVLGKAEAAAHVKDPWELQRVTYSIERCNLFFGPIEDKRKIVWAECWQRAQDYLDELGKYHADKSNMIARKGVRDASAAIRKMMEPDQEFSAVARACLESTGDDRLKSLLRTR
jgi:hypothetical protein